MHWRATYKSGHIITETSKNSYYNLDRDKLAKLEILDGDNVLASVTANNGRVPFYRCRTVITPSGRIVGRIRLLGWHEKGGVHYTIVYENGETKILDTFEGVMREPSWRSFEQV